MRHRVKVTALGRDTKQRKALVKNLLASLFQHGAIETTETKAKAVKRLADKIIVKGQPRTLNARRVLERFFGQRQIVNHIVDSVVPAVEGRTSGFTRIIRLGKRRGDDASMVKLELVAQPLAKPATAEVVEKKAGKVNRPPTSPAKSVSTSKEATKKEESVKQPAVVAKKAAPKTSKKAEPKAKKPAAKTKSK